MANSTSTDTVRTYNIPTRSRSKILLEALEPRTLFSTSPSLGVNIEGVSDFQRAFMFVDVMKASRKFGSPDTPWDQAAKVGADGWATGDFGVVIETIGTKLLASQDIPAIDGTYHLSFTGKATVAGVASPVTIANQIYNASTNTTTADVILAPGATQLMLKFTNTGGSVKNVKLIRPGYAADTTQTFTTAFLDSLQPFTALRFMDYSRTNGNTTVNWSDRTLTTSPTQATDNGAAWEYAIELANQADKDMWINVPAEANDDYVLHLAQLIKTNLEPGRHVYLEYSNEVWNFVFQQANWNYNQALAEEAANPSFLNYDSNSNPYNWAYRRVAEQLVKDATIFKTVFGADAMNTTIRPVLAAQSANPAIVRDQLNFIEHFYGAPKNSIYAIAGAPYLQLPSSLDTSSLTVDKIINGLEGNIASLTGDLVKHEAMASYYGLANLFYEGGIELQGSTGFNNAKLPANYDSRIATVINDYLNALYSNGGDMLMWYHQTGKYDTFGAWGLTESIYNTDTLKYAAIKKFASGPAPEVNLGTLLGANAVTLAGGDYTANQWENRGAGGDVWAHSGTTFDYFLKSPGALAFSFTLNIGSSSAKGHIDVMLDDQLVSTLAIPNTAGNFANLATVNLGPANTAKILAAGQLTLRLVIEGDLVVHSLTFGATAKTAPVMGDVNADGSVDATDFDIWFQHLGASSASWTQGDLNSDGHVDGADFDTWFKNLSTLASSTATADTTNLVVPASDPIAIVPTPIPEPTPVPAPEPAPAPTPATDTITTTTTTTTTTKSKKTKAPKPPRPAKKISVKPTSGKIIRGHDVSTLLSAFDQ